MFADAELSEVFAHGSHTPIRAWRALQGYSDSNVEFVDVCVIPPGADIGLHTHEPGNEEIYIIVAGEGVIHLDGAEHHVVAGDVALNRPGGTHGLTNTGSVELLLVVIEVSV